MASQLLNAPLTSIGIPNDESEWMKEILDNRSRADTSALTGVRHAAGRAIDGISEEARAERRGDNLPEAPSRK